MKNQLLPAVIALTLVSGAIYGHVRFNHSQDVREAAHLYKQPWLQVEFIVPDFKIGDNVTVNYTRNIFIKTSLDWIAEMRDARTHETVCSAGGKALVSPEEPAFYPFELSDLWGEATLTSPPPCMYEPGDYYLQFVYVTPGRKDHFAQSNIFTVKPRT